MRTGLCNKSCFTPRPGFSWQRSSSLDLGHIFLLIPVQRPAKSIFLGCVILLPQWWRVHSTCDKPLDELCSVFYHGVVASFPRFQVWAWCVFPLHSALGPNWQKFAPCNFVWLRCIPQSWAKRAVLCCVIPWPQR